MSREAYLAAFQRRAEEERPSAPGDLPELDPPSDWPHRFCTYEEARGFVTRVRANGSKEANVIAEEYGVHVNSIRRAVANVCLHVGDYDPDGWRTHERQRKAEARQRWLAYCAGRDKRKAEQRAEIVQHRDAVAHQREVAELELALDDLHVADPTRSKTTRGERQRKINARLRQYAGA